MPAYPTGLKLFDVGYPELTTPPDFSRWPRLPDSVISVGLSYCSIVDLDQASIILPLGGRFALKLDGNQITDANFSSEAFGGVNELSLQDNPILTWSPYRMPALRVVFFTQRFPGLGQSLPPWINVVQFGEDEDTENEFSPYGHYLTERQDPIRALLVLCERHIGRLYGRSALRRFPPELNRSVAAMLVGSFEEYQLI